MTAPTPEVLLAELGETREQVDLALQRTVVWAGREDWDAVAEALSSALAALEWQRDRVVILQLGLPPGAPGE